MSLPGILYVLILAIPTVPSVAQETIPERLVAIRTSAANIDAMPTLDRLSDTIGPRLAGTQAAEIAENDAARQMQAIGLTNVHLEPVTLARGWQRGYAHGEVLKPFRLPLQLASYGWTGSTPQHAGAVDVLLVQADDIEAHLDDLVAAHASEWRGKILLLSSNVQKPMHANTMLLPFLRAASRAGAIAVLRHDNRPGSHLHTEPVAFPISPADESLIPALDLPVEQQQLFEKSLSAHAPVQIAIDVKNYFTSGPIVAHNVCGEIRGHDLPQEVILLSAHLDSWDLGTGATDDGFGVAAVLGAAEAIAKSAVKPRRTLQFILFTGEEEGLLGSQSFINQHKEQLSDVRVAIALDWGAGPIRSLPTAGHTELLPALSRFNSLAPWLQLESPKNGWLFATDAYPFTLTGIAGIAPLVQDPKYSEQAHSSADTLDKVKADDLRQATAALAMLGFFLADLETLPAERFSPQQTAQSLAAGRQEPVLRALGLWPFQ